MAADLSSAWPNMAHKRSCKAFQVFDIDGKDGQNPGAFEFLYQTEESRWPRGMRYRCPCGCGHLGYLKFREKQNEPNTWVWNSNEERPTLAQSIEHIVHDGTSETTHWYGWLDDGVWIPNDLKGTAV